MATLIAFGANNIDQYFDITHWPNPGDKAVITRRQAEVGGMIGNAASVYATLGNPTISFDYLPPGEDTTYILQTLQASGVDTTLIDISPSHELNRCLIMLHEGERIVYVVSKEKTATSLTPQQIASLKPHHLFYCNPIDFIRLTNHSHVFDNECDLVFDVEYNAIIGINDPISLLSKASILFINQSAHEYLLSIDSSYLKSLPAKVIIITLGAEGSLVWKHQTLEPIPACPTTVVDTTGAGDTHHAAFLHAYTNGYGLVQAARFASAAASLSITGFGPKSGQHSEQEILEFAKSQQYEI